MKDWHFAGLFSLRAGKGQKILQPVMAEGTNNPLTYEIMGLKVKGVPVSLVNDHRLYSDNEITFKDVVFAREVLARVEKIGTQIQVSTQNESLKKEEMDPDLREAVKKLLEL